MDSERVLLHHSSARRAGISRVCLCVSWSCSQTEAPGVTQPFSLSSSPVPAVLSPQIWSRMLWLRPGCSLLAGHARSHARSPCSGCGSCLPGCICWLQPYREPSTGPGLSSGTIDPWSLGKSPRALGSMGSNSLSLFCIGPVVGEFYIWLSAHRRDRLQCSCN